MAEILDNEILYESLDYGAYILDYPAGSYMTENVRYAGAEFTKLHVRRVRLPDGRSNVVYLMNNSFENTIKTIKSGNFVIPVNYKKIFFPWVSIGSFMGRRYSMNIKKDIKRRTGIISSETKLKMNQTRNMVKSADNTFFALCDLYLAVTPIMESFPAKKNYNEFFSAFTTIFNNMTPDFGGEAGAKGFNKVLLIDCESFGFKNGAPLKDNKTNPLYLLYLAYLRTKDLSKMNVDMDMLICSKNMFLKFNPAKLNDAAQFNKFKVALFRIMNANMDDYTSMLNEEEKEEIEITDQDKIVAKAVDKAIEPYVANVSPETKAALAGAVERSFTKKVKEISKLDKEIKDTQKEVAKTIGTKAPKDEDTPDDLFKNSLIRTNPVSNPLTKKQEKLFGSIGSQYEPLTQKRNMIIEDDYEDDDYDDEERYEEEDDEEYEDRRTLKDYEDDIEDDVNEILTGSEEVVAEVLDDIQNKVAPLDNPNTAPLNSARDKKLRDQQKLIAVHNSTIDEVLARDASNVPIQSNNRSKVMHTSNQNMQNMTFVNFDKTYIDELYVRDLVACFDMLKDKNSPFYITGIDIKDTSDTLNYKETWTVHLTDENKKRHTVKVDIPKFQNDRFMWFNGTRWIILKQNFYNPLVKDTPDTVIMTTNFNKVTINRSSTKSLGTIERIFSLIKKTGDDKVFTTGDSTRSNLKYISSLEYDELSKRLFKYHSKSCMIYFSRDYIKENLSDKIPEDIKGNEFYIGHEGRIPILIDEDTGLDRMGRTIAEIIEANLSEEYKALYNSIKAPSQSMFAEGKLAGQKIPVIATLITWIGLSKTLSKMKIFWQFHPDWKRVPQQTTSRRYIRFADGVLEYEAKTFAELILNGLSKLKPEKLKFSDFDTEVGYSNYIYSQWGNYSGITQLRTFYEFLLDPITKDVCRDLYLPTEIDELLIHAVKLLADNAFVSKASDQSYRVRSIEIIPGILYKCLATQYQAYVNYGRRIPMTLKQNCVIQKLIETKTVEAYSTLNPVIEVSKAHTISTKGYNGSNSEFAYKDEEKRSYDPSSVGKIALTTSADANVGINKSLVIEPTLSNARGYREQVQDVDTLKDVNVFSPVEMLTPGTSRNDDPIRTAIASKQSQHVVPVVDASPSLISNGYDEAVQFHLSDDFVINAEEDGKVIDVNEELGFIMVQYKSGKTKAIYTKPEVVKNSGGGFYMSNQLKPTCTRVGQTFKKDEVLAYHDKYFKYSKMNGLRYAVGPIAKMAIVSSYNTYEDAGLCTERFAEKLATSIVYQENGRFKRNNNILSMVKIGDHVNIGDSLIKFDVSVEDNELAKYLNKLSDQNAEILEEETKSDIKASHAGKVINIKVYTLLDPSNLSPSLGKIVKQYFDEGLSKKDYLDKFDKNESIMKAGYMLTDSTAPIKSRYNTIKGNKGIDVLIEIYIEHKDIAGVGDKIALYSANKQIISQVIPKGFEPYSEFRPDEEISVITSPGTIARRMTPSVIPVSAAMKCLIELKRKIKAEIKYK